VGIILQGLVTGIIVSLSFGAGFFSLIQTSIIRGIRKAVFISVGVIISDAIFIFFSVFATSFISHELIKYEREIRIGGMIVLVAMGIYSLIKSARVMNASVADDPHVMYYVSKGFLINTFNPINALTWIGVALFLESALQYDIPQVVAYFVFVVIAIFGTQMAVCYSAHKLKRWLSEKTIHRTNIIVGVIFIALGGYIFFSKSSTSQTSPIEKARKIMHIKPAE
jgi:threonine/homoserine/homoserine lactone efflux protein